MGYLIFCEGHTIAPSYPIEQTFAVPFSLLSTLGHTLFFKSLKKLASDFFKHDKVKEFGAKYAESFADISG